MANTLIKIPSELFALAESSRFEGELELPVMSAGPDDYRFDAPLAWHVDVTNTGSALLVAGKVTGQARVACSRCLDDVLVDFNGDVEGYFLMNGDITNDEDDELEEDDVDASEFDILPADHIIDLEPLLIAALIVDAPTMPLCREDCAGLCTICGANLNDGACDCGPDEDLAAFERESNPFAALANYEFDE